MGWMEAIGKAIQYIEEHITDELTVDMVLQTHMRKVRRCRILCGDV